ncbi:hypothetical protein [Mucilaginibacter sp. 3215]|uniref:hypothetical protein n=1 Tax=Mucilaginibacter sp. 3215 TaxID=3373912 RepID=UPI003D1E26D7
MKLFLTVLIIFTSSILNAYSQETTIEETVTNERFKKALKVIVKNTDSVKTITMYSKGFLPNMRKLIKIDSTAIVANSIELAIINSKSIILTGAIAPPIDLTIENSHNISIKKLISSEVKINNQENNKLDIKIENSSIDDLSFGYHANNIEIKNSIFGKLFIRGSTISKTLVIKNISINTLSFTNTILPDTVIISNIDFEKESRDVNFDDIDFANNYSRVLKIGNIDLERFKIPYDKYKIIIDETTKYEQRLMIYQKVLNKLREQGLFEKFEVLDKSYQEVKLVHNGHYIINFISKNWWDYGYNKSKVTINAFILYLIFFLINLLLFDTITKVYYPSNIESYIHNKAIHDKVFHKNKLTQLITKSPSVLLYTAFIFWGLKLDLKELKIKNWWALILIVFEYTIGVICLAYIANYIITK